MTAKKVNRLLNLIYWFMGLVFFMVALLIGIGVIPVHGFNL
jgi:hypothetical protein